MNIAVEEHNVEIDGLPIRYLSAGEGPPLVLLHGAGDNSLGEVQVDRLPSLKIPTLIVWGATDRVFPDSHAREAGVRLQEGSLALIPNCGHMPHVECPDRFLGALNEFLLRRGHR